MASEEKNKQLSEDVILLDSDKDSQDCSEQTEMSSEDNKVESNSNLSTQESDDIQIIDNKTNSTNSAVISVESDGEIVDDVIEVPEESSPFCINIKFQNESIAKLYKAKFMEFINNFIELSTKCTDDLSINVIKDETINPEEWCVMDKVADTSEEIITETPAKKHRKRSKSKKELFVLDNTPSVETRNEMRLKYRSKFTINAEENESDDPKDIKMGPTCFNCDGKHQLKDCPRPKNYEKINAARQKKFQNKSTRYHLEDEHKYHNIVPGKISDQLRRALGLAENEIPKHVYMMRCFGYPPGWLEEAKIIKSDLDMFDIDGNNVKVKKIVRGGLDPEKIIEYPGFTVPQGDDVRDDHRRHGAPPYSDSFNKESIINNYKKKHEDDLEPLDMDLDQSQDESQSSLEKQEEIEEDNGDDVLMRSEEDRVSPSLIDLEQQKKELLTELIEETSTPLKETSEKQALSVKKTSYGTPILKSISEFATFPNADNFSKDISPVINFENLPNSTGKYEQMTDVLQKVRTKLKKIQDT